MVRSACVRQDEIKVRAQAARCTAKLLPAGVVVSFRITQVVDLNLGVHAMVPKPIFSEDKRKTISVV